MSEHVFTVKVEQHDAWDSDDECLTAGQFFVTPEGAAEILAIVSRDVAKLAQSNQAASPAGKPAWF